LKYLLILVIFLNGCGPLEQIENKYSKVQAKKEFKKMCKRDSGQDLLICGSKQKTIYKSEYSFLEYKYPSDNDEYISQYQLEDVFAIFSYTLDTFNATVFKYRSDKDDRYEYMLPNSQGLKKGDCEDYVITFIENCIEKGLIQRGEVKWVFGRADGVLHSWAIVTKNNKDFVFDTYYPFGISKELAYSNASYEKIFILYSY